MPKGFPAQDLSPVVAKDLRSAHKEGASRYTLAHVFNLPPSVVNALLRNRINHERIVWWHRPPKCAPCRDLPSEQAREIRERYQNGTKRRELCREFSLTTARLRKLLLNQINVEPSVWWSRAERIGQERAYAIRLAFADVRDYEAIRTRFSLTHAEARAILRNETHKEREIWWGYRATRSSLVGPSQVDAALARSIREGWRLSVPIRELRERYRVSGATVSRLIDNSLLPERECWWLRPEVSSFEPVTTETPTLTTAHASALPKRRIQRPRGKLDWPRVQEIRTRWKEGASATELAGAFSLSTSSIASIVRNRTWRVEHVWWLRGDERFPRLAQGSKLNHDDVRSIRERSREGERVAVLARDFNVSAAHVRNILHNRAWVEPVAWWLPSAR